MLEQSMRPKRIESAHHRQRSSILMPDNEVHGPNKMMVTTIWIMTKVSGHVKRK